MLSGRTLDESAAYVALPCIVVVPFTCNVEGTNRELLSKAMQSSTKLQRFQFTPFRNIQKWTGHTDDALFDTLFVYQKSLHVEEEDIKPWEVVDEEATVEVGMKQYPDLVLAF